MNPLETYLQNLFVIHSSGSAVKETSYYGTLENLLNEVGKMLKPMLTAPSTFRTISRLRAQSGLGRSIHYKRLLVVANVQTQQSMMPFIEAWFQL